MQTKSNLIAIVALTFVCAGISNRCIGAEPEMVRKEAIETAESKSDHETLAALYEAQAKELQARAQWHERTGLLYQGMEHGAGKGTQFAKHCKALAANLRHAARQSEEIAKIHSELAALATE